MVKHKRKGHLQIGGGITAENVQEWLDAGASKVRCRGTLNGGNVIADVNMYCSGMLVLGYRDIVSLSGRKVLP